MVAAAAVHAPNGFFAAGGGMEYPMVLGAASGALALVGPGRYSLDQLLGLAGARPAAGAAAVAVALVGSCVVLTRRRRSLHAEAAAVEALAANIDVLPDPAHAGRAGPARMSGPVRKCSHLFERA